MLGQQVPEPLRERLGPEATSGLLDVFEMAELEWQENVLRAATDRFERRLAEECGKLRLEMSELRQEMRAGFSVVRQDMATVKFDILKWVFVFWVGQALTLAGFLLVMARSMKGGG